VARKRNIYEKQVFPGVTTGVSTALGGKPERGLALGANKFVFNDFRERESQKPTTSGGVTKVKWVPWFKGKGEETSTPRGREPARNGGERTSVKKADCTNSPVKTGLTGKKYAIIVLKGRKFIEKDVQRGTTKKKNQRD